MEVFVFGEGYRGQGVGLPQLEVPAVSVSLGATPPFTGVTPVLFKGFWFLESRMCAPPRAWLEEEVPFPLRGGLVQSLI